MNYRNLYFKIIDKMLTVVTFFELKLRKMVITLKQKQNVSMEMFKNSQKSIHLYKVKINLSNVEHILPNSISFCHTHISSLYLIHKLL